MNINSVSREGLEAYFWQNVLVTDGCWEWVGQKLGDNYGFFGTADAGDDKQRPVYAHQMSHILFKGPIPEGHHIDHLCRNHPCSRPDHLEAVTPRVNYLRGVSPAAKKAAQTHCDHGHPFDEGNTIRTKSGRRRCRTCLTEWKQARGKGWVGEGKAWERLKTHCKNGHPFNEENTYIEIKPNGKVQRHCFACRRAGSLAHYYRKKQAVAS